MCEPSQVVEGSVLVDWPLQLLPIPRGAQAARTASRPGCRACTRRADAMPWQGTPQHELLDGEFAPVVGETTGRG